TPDMLVLAGVNAKQAVFLERWFMDTPAASPPGPTNAIGERSLLEHLGASHVDARRDLDYVLYALYPGEGPGLRQAVALMGGSAPVAPGAFLSATPPAPAAFAAGRPSYGVFPPEPTSWGVAPPGRVPPARDWILISAPASHGALVSRLAGPVRGDATD